MNQFLTQLLKKLRASQRNKARVLREQTDEVRRKITTKNETWEGTAIIRSFRDAR